MEPHHLILVGAILAAIGGIIAGIGGYLQQKQQTVFEQEARINFEKTIGSVDETLKSITGGDSFCYVTVQAGGGGGGWISNPIVWCKGEHPAHDVSVLLYDPGMLKKGMSQEELLNSGLQLDAGTIFPNGQKMLGGTREVNFSEENRKKLMAQIMTRNSIFVEDLLFRKVNNHWLRAIRLYRAKSNGLRDELIHEWAEPDFPRDDNGKILWDQ